MKATVSHLLMLQNYINSKQKTLIDLLYALCLGNISKDLTINSLKKKNRLGEVAKMFSVDFNPVDANGILDDHINI